MMEDEATCLDLFSVVRLFPCLAVSITSLHTTNPFFFLKIWFSRKNPAPVMRTPTMSPTRTTARRTQTSRIPTRKPRKRWTPTSLNPRSSILMRWLRWWLLYSRPKHLLLKLDPSVVAVPTN